MLANDGVFPRGRRRGARIEIEVTGIKFWPQCCVDTFACFSRFRDALAFVEFVADHKVTAILAKWAELFKNSGAKYVICCGEHHDGFSNWASDSNKYNAKNMGPKRDLVGDLMVAVRKKGLKVGVANHRSPTRHLTVVGHTACAMKGDEAAALDAGCDGYLTKPIDTRTFIATVKSFISSENLPHPKNTLAMNEKRTAPGATPGQKR